MKLKRFILASNIRALRFVWLLLFFLPLGLLRTAQAADAALLLERGIYAEETRGDLKKATEIYREIINDPSAERVLLAQAQLRLGLCELKLGHKPLAISALDQLARQFPDKEMLQTLLETHMPRLLEEMLAQLEQNYIQEVDRSELMETAIRAIIGKLDSRAGILRPDDMAYLAADEVTQLTDSLGQKVVGIGAVLKVDDQTQQIMIESPLAGSPALKAGLQAGDRIVEIHGAAVAGTNLAAVVKLLRGAPGSEVTVGVARPGTEGLIQVKLVRATVPLPSVLGARRKPDQGWDFMYDARRGIGYILLNQIGQQSAHEMELALQDLKARGLKALILDLRSNPGGALDGAVAIADLFLESGRIVTVKGRGEETVYDARADGSFTGFPIALLVNRQTASAAEIVAAALQDHKRATVVGERTYGQALVRTIIPLKSGPGAIKMPIAAYFRPSGKTMNRYPTSKDSDDWGVQPEQGFEVALSDAELKEFFEYRRLVSRISSPPAATPEFQDRQLKKALDWIGSQLAQP